MCNFSHLLQDILEKMEDFQVVAESIVIKREHGVMEDEADLTSYLVKKEEENVEVSGTFSMLQVKEEQQEDEDPFPATIMLFIKDEEGNVLAEDPLRMVIYEKPADKEHTVVSSKEEANDVAVLSQSHEDIRTTRSASGSRGHAKKLDKPADECRFKCSDCSRTYLYRANLSRHKLSHKVRSFNCSVCSASFSRSGRLAHHMQTHTRPFECNECNKSFSQKHYLLSHMRTHTGERPFKCTECSKSFAERTTLVKHVVTHTGERHFKCNLCCKSFSQKGNLARHVLTHTKVRAFKCNECSTSFAEKGTLARHMLTHTGQRPLKCNVCGKSFALSNSLARHLLRHEREHLFMKRVKGVKFKRTFN